MNLNHKFNLGFFPTPLHPLNNLSKQFPSFSLFIKRDDQTGLASGGNKTRKLEYLIQKALDDNCDSVITAGAQQSNHCRQTAAACAIAGLECHLLLGGDKPKKYNGNLLLSNLVGAKIHFTGENRKGEDIESLKKRLELENKNVSVIPYGGSNLLGTLGYINAIKELKQQFIEQNLKIDYIFFASSSGATQAGMMIGLDLFGVNTNLIPINIDKAETEGYLENIVFDLINQSKKYFNLNKEYTLKDIPLNRDFDKSGYGKLTKSEKNSIITLARS
ncbi:MAG: pyridoxal-phosphate dependent enzyme, partial [Flavobacteriaceae bacterium]|nr:pyridoxal-phosphate dependent enzyme [Flavobacteriaceae bacterium]